jgi:DNA-binding MarR family transcriptional regulator
MPETWSPRALKAAERQSQRRPSRGSCAGVRGRRDPVKAIDVANSMRTWATLHRADARLSIELTRRMERERGVSLNEHGSLFELNRSAGRRLRLQDLGERLGISPSSVTRLADRLEERGWIRREMPADNRRTIYAVVTLAGRRAYVRNNRAFAAAIEQAVSSRLTEDQMEQLSGLLELLATK